MSAVPGASDPGLLVSLARLSRSLLAHARMRLQLLGLELQQEKERIVVALLATLLAYLFFGVTLVLAALAIIVHYWDTPDRLAAVVWMAVLSAVVTAGLGVFAFIRFSHPSNLFQASLAELIDDEESFSAEAADDVDPIIHEGFHGGG